LHYEGTTQEVILWLKVHFVAAHYTDVDPILPPRERERHFQPQLSNSLYIERTAREKILN
jgi:hypothetical protein